MRPVEAREQLQQWLRKRGIADGAQEKAGRHAVRSADGEQCLLWLPEQDTTLFVFVLIAELRMPRDNDILALAMALNLEPSRTHGAALGYNPASKQLMLRSVHPMQGLREEALDRVLTQMSSLAGALRRYIDDYRQRETANRPVQKSHLLPPTLHPVSQLFRTH